MMKWWKRLFRNHKGFTIVELICSIAIFSIIMTSVGSALVISARSYRNGNVEMDVQQQAQIASNLLTNLIIDSDKVVQASDGKLIVEKVESGVLVTYTVFLSGSDLKYYTSIDSTERILAENISGFVINRAEGENVDFTLKVDNGGRSYESDYHVTPRNGVSSGGEALSGAISLFVENKLILEPGQTYDLNVRISGTTNTGFTIDKEGSGMNSPDTDAIAVGPGSNIIQIKVGATETDSFHFRVVSDADPSVSQNVDVLIRRVDAISVNGYKTGGNVNKAGAVYKVSAVLAGTNLEKEPGAWYDVDYVDPYTAHWTYEFTKEDEDGNIITCPAADYIEETGRGVEGNVPYVTFKLKQNLTKGCKLKVTSTALHPAGVDLADPTIKTNKSGLLYDTVSGFWELEYEAWKRNGKLDIAVRHLGDENFWIEPDGDIMYKWNARVKFTAYDSAGNLLPALAGEFDPWQREQHLPIKADLDLNNIRDKWDLTLMPYHETNTVWDWGPSYTLPYILAYYNPPEGGFNRNWYIYNAAPTFVNPGLGVAGYKIELYYEYLDESGNLANETVYEDYQVEQVSVLYRNALDASCAWQRNNKIFVTTADAITDYKVHFQFDHGWDKDDHDYHFLDMRRFVGVVADRPGYLNDVRRDITVTGMEKKKDVPDGDSVLTFTLTAADKAECKALADEADGTITVIYEYNPFMNRLPMQPKTEDELRAENPEWNNATLEADPLNPRWYKEYPLPMTVGGITLTQDIMDSMKGCEGHVIFCFKDPNIDVMGAVIPKVMYCPTITEYGPLYYIDDTTRFAIGASEAQYQEYIGGAWVTKCNLNWNGTGWTAY